METISMQTEEQALRALCRKVRELAGSGDIEGGKRTAIEAMGNHPHAPQPHNLLGLMLEKQGAHLLAMKHFRAAWALEPAYVPARQNLDQYGTFYTAAHDAYDESDCPAERPGPPADRFGESRVGRGMKKRSETSGGNRL